MTDLNAALLMLYQQEPGATLERASSRIADSPSIADLRRHVDRMVAQEVLEAYREGWAVVRVPDPLETLQAALRDILNLTDVDDIHQIAYDALGQ